MIAYSLMVKRMLGEEIKEECLRNNVSLVSKFKNKLNVQWLGNVSVCFIISV